MSDHWKPTDPVRCTWTGDGDKSCRGVAVYYVAQLHGDAEVAQACRPHLGDVVAGVLDEVGNALGVEVGRA